MKTVIRVQFHRTLKWLKRFRIIGKHDAAERMEFDMESMMPSTSTKNDQTINFIAFVVFCYFYKPANPRHDIQTDSDSAVKSNIATQKSAFATSLQAYILNFFNKQ